MKHREREREYNQKLAKFKKEERKKIETEEDLFYRLDQLEIEEELADEFNRHVIFLPLLIQFVIRSLYDYFTISF